MFVSYLIIGIKNKLTKQTVKILMRRLIRSRLIWISTVCKCMSELTRCPKLPDFTQIHTSKCQLPNNHDRYSHLETLLTVNNVNSKSYGLEVLFRIISSSNYWEVNINIHVYKPQNEHYYCFFYQI